MNLTEVFDLVLKSEGGFSNHVADPGGPTIYGITYSEYLKWKSPNRPGLKEFKKLTQEEAKQIYHAWYWVPLRCAEMNAGVAYVVFDAGLLHGIFNSARWLQLAVGTKADGHVGPKTLEALVEADKVEVITEISNFRMKRIKNLRHYKSFGNGWTNRIVRVKKKAIASV